MCRVHRPGSAPAPHSPQSAAAVPGRFHVIQVFLRRAVLRPICGERQQYFLQDLSMFLCTCLCVPFPALGILLDGSTLVKDQDFLCGPGVKSIFLSNTEDSQKRRGSQALPGTMGISHSTTQEMRY